MIAREPICAKLFERIQSIPGVVTSSRILKHWVDVPAEMQPAVYLALKNERQETRTSEPTKHWLSFDLYVYVRTSGDQVPSTVLNQIVDEIDKLFPLHPVTGYQYLDAPGVEWARIDGVIETDEGTLGEQAVAIVPITVFAT